MLDVVGLGLVYGSLVYKSYIELIVTQELNRKFYML